MATLNGRDHRLCPQLIGENEGDAGVILHRITDTFDNVISDVDLRDAAIR